MCGLFFLQNTDSYPFPVFLFNQRGTRAGEVPTGSFKKKKLMIIQGKYSLHPNL